MKKKILKIRTACSYKCSFILEKNTPLDFHHQVETRMWAREKRVEICSFNKSELCVYAPHKSILSFKNSKK